MMRWCEYGVLLLLLLLMIGDEGTLKPQEVGDGVLLILRSNVRICVGVGGNDRFSIEETSIDRKQGE